LRSPARASRSFNVGSQGSRQNAKFYGAEVNGAPRYVEW
jgi:hypothetical protein